MCGRSRSILIASAAPGQGTMRLHDVATPFSRESKIAMFTASCMPRSSQLRMRTRASGSKPSSSVLIRDHLWRVATRPYCCRVLLGSTLRSVRPGAVLRGLPGVEPLSRVFPADRELAACRFPEDELGGAHAGPDAGDPRPMGFSLCEGVERRTGHPGSERRE